MSLSRMGFGGGRGMGHYSYLNFIKFLLRKKKTNLENTKQILSMPMEERCADSIS